METIKKLMKLIKDYQFIIGIILLMALIYFGLIYEAPLPKQEVILF